MCTQLKTPSCTEEMRPLNASWNWLPQKIKSSNNMLQDFFIRSRNSRESRHSWWLQASQKDPTSATGLLDFPTLQALHYESPTRSIHNAYHIDIRKYPAIIYRTNEPINGLNSNWTIRSQERNFKGRIYPNRALQTSSSSIIYSPAKLHDTFKSSTMQVCPTKFQSRLPPQINKLTSQNYDQEQAWIRTKPLPFDPISTATVL